VGIRTCKVSYFDSHGVENTVEVTAQSLYEAVAHALRAFRENRWNDDPDRAPTALVVKIKQPEIEHKVRIRKFEDWLESAPKEPRRDGAEEPFAECSWTLDRRPIRSLEGFLDWKISEAGSKVKRRDSYMCWDR
jgi:hypothetical protein